MANAMDLQTAAVLGVFDEFSYNPDGLPVSGQRMPFGWEPISVDKGGSMVEGSFSAYAYRNTTTGQIAIAYTGTNGVGDGVTDLATMVGKWSNQFSLATDFAARLRDANPNFQILVTGHSLGAALAAVTSQMFDFGGMGLDPLAAADLVNTPEYVEQALKYTNNPAGLGVPDSSNFVSFSVSDSVFSGSTGQQIGQQQTLPALGFSWSDSALSIFAGIVNPVAGVGTLLYRDQVGNKHAVTQAAQALRLLAAAQTQDQISSTGLLPAGAMLRARHETLVSNGVAITGGILSNQLEAVNASGTVVAVLKFSGDLQNRKVEVFAPDGASPALQCTDSTAANIQPGNLICYNPADSTSNVFNLGTGEHVGQMQVMPVPTLNTTTTGQSLVWNFLTGDKAGQTLTVTPDGSLIFNEAQIAELSGKMINSLTATGAPVDVASPIGLDHFNGVVNATLTQTGTTDLLASFTYQAIWDGNTRLGTNITRYDFSTSILTQTVDTIINGNTVNVTYTYDAITGEPVPHVNSINGQLPIDQAATDAAFRETGILPGQLIHGDAGVAGTNVSGVVATFDAAHPTGLQTLTTALTNTIDALSLVKAIQSGDPLPITVSGLRLANTLSILNGSAPNYALNGASSVGGGILSVMSLDAALKRGDTLGAVTTGAQTLSYGVQAYASLALDTTANVAGGTTQSMYEFLNGTPGTPTGALPYLNLVNSISHGDEVGAAMAAISMTPAAPVAYAYYAFEMITSLFGGSDAPPEAWGSAHAQWSGFSAVANATGAYGGLETAKQTYNGILSYLDQLAAQEQAANPGSAIGIVANRLPSLSYRNYTGYQITDIDPLTGEQRIPGVLYDLAGRPYNAPAGSVQASQSLNERMIRVALERGAVAPLWEVETAALQTRGGDPMAGFTEEERAGRAGRLAPALAADATSQIFRPVALDLNGDGVQTTGAAKTAAFNVDDSGYLKSTAWLNNNDGFLFLDRNLNGQIDGGKELFSNATVALSERGLNGVRWIDSNYDGSISTADPVWNELKVWQDANGNGISDAGEVKTFAQLGITSINYSMGTFERNGQLSQLSSPDLVADTQGAITYTVPEGIVVQTSQGQISLLASRIDDKSAIQANRDGVAGYEDTELIISAADLLANDTLAGMLVSNLSIAGVSGFTHGSGFLDGNGFVHYTPDANYYGAAQFDYSIKASTGQTASATVDITLQNVNDAPIVTLDQHLRGIYGYDMKYRFYKGDYVPTSGLGAPHYAPYSGYDALTGTTGMHDTIALWDDPDGPNNATIVVTDIDDPAGPFSFEIVAQAQKGEGSVDTNGNVTYTNWFAPNMPGNSPDGQDYMGRDTYVDTYSTQADPFTVRVADSHGASTTIQVDAVHTGAYNPSLGSGGGGKPISVDLDGNGFNFTKVDDSNVFFDINSDGWKRRMAWVAPGDGLLAFDANGDGLIDNGREICFAGYQPDAQTDLEGLRAFDTNNDGLFSALDEQWDKFGIWQDANQDGITDTGEFGMMDALDIAAVSLVSDDQFSVINGQTLHGIGTVTMTDGSTLNLADVTLQYSNEVLVTGAEGSPGVAIKTAFAPNGEVITGTPDKDLLLGNNGNTIIEALEGDDVVMSDIGNDVIDAGSGNDVIYAGGGNDLIIGGVGDDVVFAGQGSDVVLGGDGHDALFGEGGNDVIFGGNGNDLISGGDGNNVLTGDAGDDQVYGGTGNDALFGGAGNDELAGMEGFDLLDGGPGNDTYLFGCGDGQDTISDCDATAGNIDTIRLGANILASDVKITRDLSNLYISINDTTDKLTLVNWFLNDEYRIEQLVLADGVMWDVAEQAALLSIPTEDDDFLVGTAGNDVIDALGGNDTLAGGAGNDYLKGGSGNDTYLFGRGAGQNIVHEYDTAVGNIDTIKLAADVNPAGVAVTREADDLYISIKNTTDKMAVLGWFASDASKVERVEFADGTAWDVMTLATKAADFALNGDGGSMILGTAGNDTLLGNALSNMLDGGVGVDTMMGGVGDDSYIVDNTGDLVIENPNEGNDSVYADISYTLTSNVEHLVLTGSANLNGTGNALDNFISGNTGNNLLDGGYGADTLSGGQGDDTYMVDSVGDIVIETPNAGMDSILSGINYKLMANVENLVLTGSAGISGTGNALDNFITGNAGNNRIDGGAGADTMLGGAGNDVYLVDNAGDVVVEEDDAGFDTVQAGFDYTLGNNVESLLLTGTGNINGTGNALANLLTGNVGNNLLDGGLGQDAMQGGAGDDTYIVDNADDRVMESLDGGIDTVRAGVTYILASEVENMVLTGNMDINGTGNELDNAIAGNSGSNRIDGGFGADTMAGGAGNDTYVVDDAGDIVTEGVNAGIDTVESGITYALTDNVENLTLTGAADIDGSGNELDNAITGNAANNILDGAAGADAMAGGAGDDVCIVDNAADVVVENINEGTDVVYSSVSYGLSPNVENLILAGADDTNGTGNEMDNVITGNDVANILSGLDGNDTLVANGGNDLLDGGLGADSMLGGLGDDTYIVDDIGDLVTEDLNAGIDTVLSGIGYTLTDNVENLMLTGMDALNGTGNALDNAIIGNVTNNILDGAAGADMMVGGAGDDTYIVDNAADVVVENLNEGVDIVLSSVSHGLLTNVENLTLTGTDDINGTGNELDNALIGNSGNNRIDGGLGADAMAGGAGNDTYVVDDAGDIVIESVNAGVDTVESGITYTLTDSVENLVLIGTADIDGSGNELDNTLVGNDGNNRLFGDPGNDILLADGGNDLLDGGDGADTMVGGADDDTYVVDNLGDLVIEHFNAGVDSVESGISYALAANVENLILAGVDAIDGTGNELDNVITGSTANNILDGAAGADVMAGGAGDDTYIVDNAADVVVENLDEGTDIVFSSVSYGLSANTENLTLTDTAGINGTGNELNNLLVGNDAANTLTGLDGNDTLIANAGNDLLDGGLGADTMAGGAGADFYLVDNALDVVVEYLNEGIDTILSLISYKLSANVENLTLAGTADINGTGNEMDNVLIGNSGSNLLNGLDGNDFLDGGPGADVMAGGIGDDTYVIDHVGDLVMEAGGKEHDDKHDSKRDGDEHEDDDMNCAWPEYLSGGIDTVLSSINYVLGSNVENLVLNGSEAVNGTGNKLDNILVGNAAANVLKGKGGDDTLIGNGGADILVGGEGDDTYYVDDMQSLLVEERKEGVDTVVSSVSYVLKDNFENLTLTGALSTCATGNALDNVLIGNEGNNILSGGEGDDRLDGGCGIDTLLGGSGDDVYVVDNIGDIVIENRKDGMDTVRSTVSYTLANNVENLTLIGVDDINGIGNALDNVIIGNAGASMLSGLDGNDTLQGNTASDVLQGGNGNDILRDNGGNNLLDGGRGADYLSGNAGNELFAGGTGNDVIHTGDGADIIAFNRGDGRDVVHGGVGTDNTLSLGGNIHYKDIALTRADDDLVLEIGDKDQITFKSWYETDANYKSVLNLQVVADAMAKFDASSSDLLLNRSVQRFDFTAIVNAFDQACDNKSGKGSFRHWSVMNALLDAHLAANDTAALGGDLAYQYGRNGAMTGVSLAAAQDFIGDSQFGLQAQTLSRLQTVGVEVVRLG